MKAFVAFALAILVTAGAHALYGVNAQQTGSKRTTLQQHDLSVPGREVIQVLVEFAPGVTASRHFHPGEEIVYVVSGSIEYEVEGMQPLTLEAGEVLFIPARRVHAARNVGSGTGAELATYIVETGQPLVTPAD